MLHSGIPAITAGPSLSPSSYTRQRDRLPCGAPARENEFSGRDDGLTEFRLNNTTGVGAVSSPITCVAVCSQSKGEQPVTYRFGSGVSATFRLFSITTFIDRSLTFTRPASLASHPPVAGEIHTDPHGPVCPEGDYVVRALHTRPLPAAHCP